MVNDVLTYEKALLRNRAAGLFLVYSLGLKTFGFRLFLVR